MARRRPTENSRNVRTKTKPKTRTLHTWNIEAMEQALAAVANGSMSQRKAVAFYNVPRSTLRDRLKDGLVVKPKLGRKPLLTMDDETKLVDYACNRAELGIGFGKTEFLRYAGDLAKKRRLAFKHGRPSQKWWRLLKKRHGKITRRKPEGTATIRHKQMNKVYVGRYYYC